MTRARARRGARCDRHRGHARQASLRDDGRLRERLELALEGRQLVGDGLQRDGLVVERRGEAGPKDGVLGVDGEWHGFPGAVLRLRGDHGDAGLAGALVVLPGGVEQPRVGCVVYDAVLVLGHVGRPCVLSALRAAHGFPR